MSNPKPHPWRRGALHPTSEAAMEPDTRQPRPQPPFAIRLPKESSHAADNAPPGDSLPPLPPFPVPDHHLPPTSSSASQPSSSQPKSPWAAKLGDARANGTAPPKNPPPLIHTVPPHLQAAEDSFRAANGGSKSPFDRSSTGPAAPKAEPTLKNPSVSVVSSAPPPMGLPGGGQPLPPEPRTSGLPAAKVEDTVRPMAAEPRSPFERSNSQTAASPVSPFMHSPLSPFASAGLPQLPATPGGGGGPGADRPALKEAPDSEDPPERSPMFGKAMVRPAFAVPVIKTKNISKAVAAPISAAIGVLSPPEEFLDSPMDAAKIFFSPTKKISPAHSQFPQRPGFIIPFDERRPPEVPLPPLPPPPPATPAPTMESAAQPEKPAPMPTGPPTIAVDLATPEPRVPAAKPAKPMSSAEAHGLVESRKQRIVASAPNVIMCTDPRSPQFSELKPSSSPLTPPSQRPPKPNITLPNRKTSKDDPLLGRSQSAEASKILLKAGSAHSVRSASSSANGSPALVRRLLDSTRGKGASESELGGSRSQLGSNAMMNEEMERTERAHRPNVDVPILPKSSSGLFSGAGTEKEEFEDPKYSMLRRALLETFQLQVDYPLLMPPDLLGMLADEF
ncbi:hypothetical protein DFS34DRAFT_385368 [Phlyctochytrium arcticum]|nr:hypothetical protein DFS34DRAFT_385368 [Phlyctochytrium arcticum]